MTDPEVPPRPGGRAPPAGGALTPDDLLRLLDLDGADAPLVGAGPPLLAPVDPPAGLPAGPTALVLDAWALRRGRELLAASERLRRLDPGEPAAADFLAAAFDPDPRLTPACADPLRHEFLARLFDTPDYRALHAATALCDAAAAVAAVAFAEEFAALTAAHTARPGADPGGREMAALRAAARAAAAADKEVGGLRDAAAALGLGSGGPGSLDPRAVAALFKRVRTDPALRRVCDLAGRFRRVAQSRQRQKAAHGADDVIGVAVGGDVARLLTSELVRLVVPELELETLRRIVERTALCREHHAVEPVGKGPVIAVVDESGSMQGAKAETAKALTLALAWVARRQRRWCALVAYSGDSGERLLALPPGRWDGPAVADWVAAFLGRGSDLDLPIRELPDYYRRLGAPPGVTDVLFVTDARCTIPADLAARFAAWKRTVKARVISLVVGGEPGDLAAVIRQVAEDEAAVTFQFTAESRDGDRFAYALETILTLDKKTGTVACDRPGLATLAQEELDRAIDARTGADLTRVIQKLFDRHADLFPVRPQGGVYFGAIRSLETAA